MLIRPLHVSTFYDPEVQEPLGLEYLAATLRAGGHAVLILDRALHGLDIVTLARRTAAFEPDVVGFSLMVADAAREACRVQVEVRATCTSDTRCAGWLVGTSCRPNLALPSACSPPRRTAVRGSTPASSFW